MENIKKNLLIAWLKDAYAMEKSIIQTLTAHSKEAEEYPEIQDKINEHIEATESQSERIKNRLEAMGENVSGIKAFTMEIMGKAKGYAEKFSEDKIIKNTLAEIATESYEISAYQTILLTAEKLGDEETVEMAEEILQEEKEMENWAKDNLPVLIGLFFEKETAETHADEEI